MGYFAPLKVYAVGDHQLGARAQVALSGDVYGLAVFAPYLLGIMLFPPVSAIALRRARVIPIPALAAVLVGSVVFAVLAGPWWATVVWGAGLLVGFAPAVRQGFVDGRRGQPGLSVESTAAAHVH